MGWRSFFVIYKNDSERNLILKCVADHNACINDNIVGEEVGPLCYNSIDKCVLFGNGYGGDRTYNYFANNGFDIHYLEKFIDPDIDTYKDSFGHPFDVSENIYIEIDRDGNITRSSNK